MKRLGLGILIGLLLILVSACGTTSENLTGEQQFSRSCASCHGADLKSGYAADLDQIGSKYTVEEIEEIIKNGKGRMRGGVIRGEAVTKVAEWLATQK